MRKIAYSLLISSLLVLIIFIFSEPVIILLAKCQLKKVFIGSVISIKDCSLKPTHLLSFSDIEIKKENLYDFKFSKIEIQYNIFSLLRRGIVKLSLQQAGISVSLPHKSIFEMTKFIKLAPSSAFFICSLELSGLELNLNSNDLTLLAKLSSDFNLSKQSINYLKLKIDLLDAKGFRLENASLNIEQNMSGGELFIQKIGYDKLIIKEIKGKAKLEKDSLSFDHITAELFNGEFTGYFALKINKDRVYLVNLKFINIDLEEFVKDFNLDDKFEASGKLGGVLSLKGRNLNIESLNGDFSTSESGGKLVIKDARFLENLANSSKQSFDLLVENFKDYHYNTGLTKLSLDKGNLIFNIALEGGDGRRNLIITVHNFKLGRGEL